MDGATYTIIGFCLTVCIWLFGVTYRTGHVAARVEELERWRINVRQDFHEVSDKLDLVVVELKHLTTVIEERTERRATPRAGG